MISNFRVLPIAVILAVCIFCLPAFAQGEGGRIEASGSAGIVTGIGTHGSLSLGGAATLTDRFRVSGDFMYIPLGSQSLDVLGVQSEFSARAIGFNIGGQYDVKRTDKWKPYVGGGVGFIHTSSDSSVTATVAGFNLNGGSSDTNAFLSLGGGARYYISDHFGFKPDLTLFLGHRTFVNASGGIFFQFRR
jgi:opacity protein-like surface antigen